LNQKQGLARRLAREAPDVTERWDGDGIGDSADSDGEPIDEQVGDSRAGRLVAFGTDPADPTTDYRAYDVGIDGGAASAAALPPLSSSILWPRRIRPTLRESAASFCDATVSPSPVVRRNCIAPEGLTVLNRAPAYVLTRVIGTAG
jgi:hypothetical protein